MNGVRWPGFARLARYMTMMTCGLCGCASLQVKMGLKVSLAKTPVISMAPSLVRGPGIGPGMKDKLIVSFQTSGGKTLTTQGAGHGKVMWRDLAMTASVVKVSKKGKVSLDGDPRISDKQTGLLTISIPSQPAIHATLDVPVQYDYAFRAIYSGFNGTDGWNGTNGTDGSDGSPGSADPEHPSPGGNGGNGTSGTDGGNGSDGGDGPDVQVMFRWRHKTHLLQASVTSGNGNPRYFLIDPHGGSLTVRSAGGSGGQGGHGGKGGRGGSGGIGWPDGASGMSGSDGRDGVPGSDGRPGTVTVIYDPDAAPYLQALNVPQGSVMREAPIPKMW